MILDKFRYPFLGRMRRAEGLPPKVPHNFKIRLGTSPAGVFEASLSLALVLTICGFVFYPVSVGKARKVEITQEIVKIEDIEITRQIDRPPPPPRPLIPIEAPSDEVLEDVTIQETELHVAANIPAPQPKSGGEDDASEEYFVVVEEMPEVIGGLESIMSRLVYPDLAIRAGIQGKVLVQAYVSEKGEVVRAEVVKGIGALCDQAALEAVKQAKFIPGRQRGRAMKTRVIIPIRFNLSASKM